MIGVIRTMIEFLSRFVGFVPFAIDFRLRSLHRAICCKIFVHAKSIAR